MYTQHVHPSLSLFFLTRMTFGTLKREKEKKRKIVNGKVLCRKRCEHSHRRLLLKRHKVTAFWNSKRTLVQTGQVCKWTPSPVLLGASEFDAAYLAPKLPPTGHSEVISSPPLGCPSLFTSLSPCTCKLFLLVLLLLVLLLPSSTNITTSHIHIHIHLHNEPPQLREHEA